MATSSVRGTPPATNFLQAAMTSAAKHIDETTRATSRAAGSFFGNIAGVIESNPGAAALIGVGLLGLGAAGVYAATRGAEEAREPRDPLAHSGGSASRAARAAASAGIPAPSSIGVSGRMRLSRPHAGGVVAEAAAATTGLSGVALALPSVAGPSGSTPFTPCQHLQDLPGLSNEDRKFFNNLFPLVATLESPTLPSTGIPFLLGTCKSGDAFDPNAILERLSRERADITPDTLVEKLDDPSVRSHLRKIVFETLDSWISSKHGISLPEFDHQTYELLTSSTKRFQPFAGMMNRHNSVSQYAEVTALLIQRRGAHALPTRESGMRLGRCPSLNTRDIPAEHTERATKLKTAHPSLHTLFSQVQSLSNKAALVKASNCDIRKSLDRAGRNMNGFDLKQKVLTRIAERMHISPGLAEWVLAFPENASILNWAIGDAVDEWLSTELGIKNTSFWESLDTKVYEQTLETARSAPDTARKQRVREQISLDPLFGRNNRRNFFSPISDFFSLILGFFRDGRSPN